MYTCTPADIVSTKTVRIDEKLKGIVQAPNPENLETLVIFGTIAKLLLQQVQH